MRAPSRLVLFTPPILFLSACTSIDKLGSLPTGINETSLTIAPVECAALVPSSTCTISNPEQASSGYWIYGDVLAGPLIYKNGGIQVGNDGRIVTVGCITATSNATVISCPNQVISAGLINPHDHLSYNQNFPGGQNPGTTPPNPNYLKCNDPQNAYANPDCSTYRYDRRNEWRKGLEGKPAINAPWGGDPQAVVWNELRHVLGGATTVAGSGGAIGLVRNPDVLTLMEGLTTPDSKYVDYNTFPLGDTTDVQGHDFGDCHYPNVVTTAVLDNLIFLPHVAEGINEYAQNEVYCLTGSGDGSVAVQAPNSTFIHSVAANPGNASTVKNADMTLVWSPRSNLSLYGNTAQAAMYDNMGIRIALSSDWTPSGSINMLREMFCANSFNSTYLGNHFSKQDLWAMSTFNAAHALGIDDQTGLIWPGYWADITIYNAIGKGYTSYYDPMIYSDVGDVSLVLRGGIPLYGDATIVQALNGQCESMGDVCGSSKAVCLTETGFTLSDLQTFNTNSYPLYFCSAPSDEPSCTPARYGEYSGATTSDDVDGDGIANSADNCPGTFNPIRPMDNNVQADYNHNGIGDACDPNPL